MASMASIQIFQLDLLVDGGREIRAPQRGDPPRSAGGWLLSACHCPPVLPRRGLPNKAGTAWQADAGCAPFVEDDLLGELLS